MGGGKVVQRGRGYCCSIAHLCLPVYVISKRKLSIRNDLTMSGRAICSSVCERGREGGLGDCKGREGELKCCGIKPTTN